MKLTFEDIKNNASQKTIERAKTYLDQFISWEKRGEELFGEVKGSGNNIYQLKVNGSDPAYLEAQCSCPVKNSFCKHATALCLLYLGLQDKIAITTATPEEIVLAMQENELKKKLIALFPEFPELAERLTGKPIFEMSPRVDENLEDNWESIEF